MVGIVIVFMLCATVLIILLTDNFNVTINVNRKSYTDEEQVKKYLEIETTSIRLEDLINTINSKDEKEPNEEDIKEILEDVNNIFFGVTGDEDEG